MKGFASRTSENNVFVWMYRKNTPAREVNILKIGVEKDFYGKVTEANVDDQITEIEPAYSDLLADLRLRPISCRLDDERIPSLITHLTFRTRFLRQSMLDTLSILIDSVHSNLRDEETLRKMIWQDPRIQHLLRTELAGRGVEESHMEKAIALLEPHFPKVVELVPECSQLIDELVRKASSEIPRAIRAAHITALTKLPDEDARAESYAKLNWFIVLVKSPLFLGDTACIYETTGQRWFTPIHETRDALAKVLLPVAHDRLIVGTPLSTCPTIDALSINKAVTRCSYEYFIGPVQLQPESSLLKSIGRWSGILGDSDVDKISAELKTSLVTPKRSARDPKVE